MKDLLLEDFQKDSLNKDAIKKFKGGQGDPGTSVDIDTDDTCTEGDVGCCDTDSKNMPDRPSIQ